MFLGKFELRMDDEHGVTIPPAFRGMFAEGAYITRGFEQNLLIMNETAFLEKYKKVISLNIADPTVRLLLRLILANAARLEMNPAGRVCIPAELTTFAALEKDLILVGQGDYIEAWAPSSWEKQSDILLDINANTTRFAQLDLALA